MRSKQNDISKFSFHTYSINLMQATLAPSNQLRYSWPWEVPQCVLTAGVQRLGHSQPHLWKIPEGQVRLRNQLISLRVWTLLLRDGAQGRGILLSSELVGRDFGPAHIAGRRLQVEPGIRVPAARGDGCHAGLWPGELFNFSGWKPGPLFGSFLPLNVVGGRWWTCKVPRVIRLAASIFKLVVLLSTLLSKTFSGAIQSTPQRYPFIISSITMLKELNKKPLFVHCVFYYQASVFTNIVN